MTQGIWLSPHQFSELSEISSNQLTSEMASRAGSYMGQWMDILPDPDPVLQQSGEGQAALEALSKDYKVTSSLQTRKLKTLGLQQYSFTAGCLPGESATPQAEALCAALSRDLERVDLFNVISEVLDAPAFGYTVAELMWKRSATRLQLVNIVPKPRKWFAYDTTNTLRYIGSEQAVAQGGVVPPYGKFVVARHFPTYENPYGLRLLSRCLFPVAFKRGGIEFMMRFAERWGMPWIVGEGRPGAPMAELQNMRNALVGMVQDAVAVISSGSKVQLMQASGQSGDLHLSIVKFWDDAIAQVIQGQTLTSTVGDTGSYAASKTHGEVLDDYAMADATLVKIFFDELAYTYGQLNAPGVLTPTFSFDDEEDQAAKAALSKELYEQGVRFTPVYYERKFNLAPDEFTMASSQQPIAAPQTDAAFAAPNAQKHFSPGQQAIEDLVAELLPKGVQATKEMINQILALVNKATTPEELTELLAQALSPANKGGLSFAHFQGVLETAMFAADMTGRFAARENVE